MGGLAMGIMVVIALMLLGGFGLAFWLGKRSGGTGRGVIFGVIGLGIAALGVAATFYESSFSPPPRLDLKVPAGYAQSWTILLEDPRAPAGLEWQGSGLPFSQRSASIALSESGVLRLRSLGEAIGRGDLEVRWSDGANALATGGGPAPAGSGATNYILLGRARADGSLPEAPMGDALAAEIAAREGR